MEFSNKCCAGIVTYNPDIYLLRQNIEAIIKQVACVVIVDNGSSNELDIIKLVEEYNAITLVPLKCNKGIAYALNCIAKFSLLNSHPWFLTLDQDSVCPSNLIESYSKFTENDSCGIITPRIRLRIDDPKRNANLPPYEFIDVAITSGCLMRYEAYTKAGGFWNFLFIDKVDDDICYEIRKAGYKIIRDNNVLLNHQIGNPQKKKILGFQYYTDSYSAFRYYYIARNTIIVYSFNNNVRQVYSSLLKRFVKILIGENNKKNKMTNFLHGVYDGLKSVRCASKYPVRDSSVIEI